MMQKVGFFGGTFDPIHFGHINLALQIYEICKLDHVLFCPARCSPDKKSDPPKVDFEKRAEMVRLAIEDIPYFSLTTIENKQKGLSYTLDTLEFLKKENNKYRDVKFHLILSADTIKTFHQWKNVKKLCELAPPLFGIRNDPMPDSQVCQNQDLLPWIQKGLIKSKVIDISSTEIRDRIKKKLYCGHLLPAKVLDFISLHGLYC